MWKVWKKNNCKVLIWFLHKRVLLKVYFYVCSMSHFHNINSQVFLHNCKSLFYFLLVNHSYTVVIARVQTSAFLCKYYLTMFYYKLFCNINSSYKCMALFLQRPFMKIQGLLLKPRKANDSLIICLSGKRISPVIPSLRISIHIGKKLF